MNFRGGNVQAQRDIVDSAGANPADTVLDGMEHRQQTVPLSKGVTVRSRARLAGLPVATLPA
jgi:hypothetical protein